MEKKKEEEVDHHHHHHNEEEEEPVSPTGQYFNSSVLSISVLAVLESQIPIDMGCPTDHETLLNDLFLPINPRFSSIMVVDKNGVKQWKRVQLNLKDHINAPIFPPGKSPEFYDGLFNDYLTKIAGNQFPQSRPLWEIHIIKYPTRNAAGNIIFKLHHSLGDGFSLMGALLSCLQRADNPTLPLTFPVLRANPLQYSEGKKESILTSVPRAFSGFFNTVSDFGWSILKSGFMGDDRTAIRSGEEGAEFRPVAVTTMTFSLDHIKQIKTNLQVTINDVITGIIFYGTRLYMKEKSHDDLGESSGSTSTALVLLNTRNIAGYKSLDEMVRPNNDTKWGNQFGFLHIPIPELISADDDDDDDDQSSNPKHFVFKAQQIIKRKRNSAAVPLTGKLLDTLRRYRGPEATARYLHSTLKNSSMTVSNIIGPVEQMALANHPIAGMYFMVVGVPQSLTITMMSYKGKLRVAIGAEKGYIDQEKFKSCVHKAFEMMFKATV